MKIYISGDGKIPAKKNRMKIYGNRLVKDSGVRNFEKELMAKALTIMSALDVPVIEEPVSLHLMVIEGDKRRRDLQNYFGSICDALNKIVYKDDSQIQKLTAERLHIKGQFGYTIVIEIIKKRRDNGEAGKEEGSNKGV